MGTRGAIVLVDQDGRELVAYNHYDSYPSGLGLAMLRELRSIEWDSLEVQAQVKSLRLLNEQDTAVNSDIALARRWELSEAVSSGEDNYAVFRGLQGSIAKPLQVGVWLAAHPDWPLDSLFCEWLYLVDLSTGMFEVYRGFQQGPVVGRWADKRQVAEHRDAADQYSPVTLVRSWPLGKLPGPKELEDLEAAVYAEAE